MSYQSVTIVGNLGSDPETKTIPKGDMVCEFRVAVNEKWKGGEHVEWFRCQAWGKLAEVCGKYLSKGKQVLVTGRLRTRSWEDKDGVKRYTTELRANEVKFLSGGGEKSETRSKTPPMGGGDDFAGFDAPNDDIPFALSDFSVDRVRGA